MIARDAIYDFAADLIADSATSDALFDAQVFKNLKGSVDEAQKVVRVDVIEGTMVTANDASRQEQGVRFTAQFWYSPDEITDDSFFDDAQDASFEMARQFFDALRIDQTLGGRVCLADIPEDGANFETGTATLGSLRRGVTYLDGVINPLGQEL